MSVTSTHADRAPLDHDDHTFVLETLRQEAMELFAQQRAINDKGTRALAFGFTVLAGFAAYGVAGKAPGHELLLRALPVALGLIAIELLQNFATEGALAQAREAIERALHDHLNNTTVLVYDSYVRNREGVDRFPAVVAIVFAALYVCVVVLTQLPGVPATHPVAHADDIVWVARFATAVTFMGLVAMGIGVFSEPKAVKKKLADEAITIPAKAR